MSDTSIRVNIVLQKKLHDWAVKKAQEKGLTVAAFIRMKLIEVCVNEQMESKK